MTAANETRPFNSSTVPSAQRHQARGVTVGWHLMPESCWVAWCRVDGRLVAVCGDEVESEADAVAWCRDEMRRRS